MTRLPPSSLNLTHIRSISPQSTLPTVPTASAPSISPRFRGLRNASSIFWENSSGSLILFHVVTRKGWINLYTPGVNSDRERFNIRKPVPGEIRGSIQAAYSVMTQKDDLTIFWPGGHHLLH